jgi:beta-ketodecanoyl-[acyl-carrier-protein] synthase
MNLLISRMVLGRDAEPGEAPVILDTYANTSSAGSVIAFHKPRKICSRASWAVICSFGAGYSIGCVVVKRLIPRPANWPAPCRPAFSCLRPAPCEAHSAR